MNRKRASIRCVRPPAPRGDSTWAQPSIILLGASQQADQRHGRLLRARRKRPCGRSTAEQRYELAAFSFNHLVGSGKQSFWHFEAKTPCRLPVDNQLEFAGLHHWQISGLGAF